MFGSTPRPSIVAIAQSPTWPRFRLTLDGCQTVFEEVRPNESSESVQVNPVVVKRSRLSDVIADLSVGAMEHVPVAQDVRCP
jgi:hypothetical protein